ncbi:uncharacterized protein LOC129718255 [Wyeomyia smithii]|uniref:uncharacterized protein LOC129718255 n=1 Tax=Wyeomyia smithii TaxID=174621 RepID=UPI002467C594|nr:uncharacterized protein LOC129718255 [Wyeomyia smithii]
MSNESCSSSIVSEPEQAEVNHFIPDAESQLLRTFRKSLENSAYLRKARCEMRKKVLETIQASEESNLFTIGRGQPPRAVQLINQLILEYFDWYNLQYSGEMFSVESETPRMAAAVRRQTLVASLCPRLDEPLQFQSDLPVLAELVMKMAVEEKNHSPAVESSP